VRFRRPVAAAASVDALKANVRKGLAAARAEIKRVDQRQDKNTSTLDKKVNVVDGRVTKVAKDLKQAQSQMQMQSILPLLLTSKPQVETIRFDADPTPNTDLKAEVKYSKGDDNLLLPLLLLSGGFGSGGGGGGGMNVAILALALSK
jgi:hypothetical protein